MMPRKLFILVLLTFLLAWRVAAQTPATNPFVIASWNVENLFDPYNDPANPGAVDYTPGGWARWTPARYALKLDHLAEVIAAMQPDVLCLIEVENRRVLEDLVRVLREKRGYDLPVILHREGGDRRGIDVAMLARTAPVATSWITPYPQQRDILVARFEVSGRPLTVCLNHWKSWVGPQKENVQIRTVEARASRAEVAQRLAATPAAAVLALGDFNDNIDAASLTREAGFVPWTPQAAATNQAAVLYNLSGMLTGAVARGTYYYGKDRVWNSFDSISVSPGMLSGGALTSAWQVVTGSYGPFALPQQRDGEGRPLPFHRMRKKDERGVIRDTYFTGYSDHFPVRVVLQPAGDR
ncbi:MAG: endonuclease/exonuclease/phosphatase family protein [bacterium]